MHQIYVDPESADKIMSTFHNQIQHRQAHNKLENENLLRSLAFKKKSVSNEKRATQLKAEHSSL